jgi:hypothetical protein
MSYNKLIFLIWAILLFFFILTKARNKRILILAAGLLLLIPLFLPRQLWGKWDSIKMLKGKKIRKILLLPSEPDWEVNLTDSPELIKVSNKINKIMDYLRKTEVYFPNHPRRIWETELIFITTGNDSIYLKIQKTDNNGTVIYTSDNQWRKDEIAEYLERIVEFSKPLRAKKS